jgi:Zn finger protein HypA/HybF involved in hydrogenase expression
MSKVLACPHCDNSVTVGVQLYGRVMGCPHCAKHFTVADADGQAIPVAAPMGNFPYSMHAIRFTFSCMRCASVLEARGDHGGTKGRCPTCGAVFVIPQVDPRTGVPLTAASVADDGQLPTPMHAYATAGAKAPKIIRLENGEEAIQCPRCNHTSAADSNQCPSCGTPYTIEGADAVIRGGSDANGMATAAITVAILGLCLPFVGLLAAGLGWAGIAKSTEMGQSRPGYGLSVAAVVIGLVSTAGYSLKYFFL